MKYIFFFLLIIISICESSITSGLFTIDSSGNGDYLTIETAIADLGTLDGDLVFQFTSDIIDVSSGETMDNNIGSHTLIFDGNGHSFENKTDKHSFNIRVTSSGGNITFRNLKLYQSTVCNARALILGINITGGITIDVHDCFFIADTSVSVYGVRSQDTDIIVNIYNCMFTDFKYRASIATDACHINSLIENCTIINSIRGIDFKGVTVGDGILTAKNCVVLNCIDGAYWQKDAATLENCASDDLTASDTSIMSMNINYLFRDTSVNSPNYLIPVDTGLLYCRASSPVNRPDNSYFNNSILGISSNFSYGNSSFPVWPVIVDLHDSICLNQGFTVDEKLLNMYSNGQSLSGQATITTTNTDSVQVDQLIVYLGKNGFYYTGMVESINDGVSITLTKDLQDTIEDGVKVWSFYINDSHPSTPGYYAIADYYFSKIGDTLTNGILTVAGDSWIAFGSVTSRLETLLPEMTIFTNGYSGKTSSDLLSYYNDSIVPNNSDYVLILIGTNDWSGGIKSPVYQQNIMGLINKIRLDGAIPQIFTSSCAPVSNNAQTLLANSYNNSIIASFVDTSFNFLGANGMSMNDTIPQIDSIRPFRQYVNQFNWSLRPKKLDIYGSNFGSTPNRLLLNSATSQYIITTFDFWIDSHIILTIPTSINKGAKSFKVINSLNDTSMISSSGDSVYLYKPRVR